MMLEIRKLENKIKRERERKRKITCLRAWENMKFRMDAS